MEGFGQQLCSVTVTKAADESGFEHKTSTTNTLKESWTIDALCLEHIKIYNLSRIKEKNKQQTLVERREIHATLCGDGLSVFILLVL